jgi:cell division protein FtsQ
MTALFSRKRKNKMPAYRSNGWKGLRASQAADERQQARRSRIAGRYRRAAFAIGSMLGLALVAGGAFAAIRELGPLFQRGLEIREVKVEGVRHVTKQDVLDRLALKKGLALHQVSLSFLAERLRTHPWIKEATVERYLLHELRISVAERKPAAVALVGVEHLLVDGEGVLLLRLGNQDDATLPLLTGADGKLLQQGDREARRRIQSAIELARLMAHSVEGRVEIDVSNPLSLIASAKGVRFQFGSEALSDQWDRFRKVKAAAKVLTLEGKRREGSEVDLRYDHRVIVRERG